MIRVDGRLENVSNGISSAAPGRSYLKVAGDLLQMLDWSTLNIACGMLPNLTSATHVTNLVCFTDSSGNGSPTSITVYNSAPNARRDFWISSQSGATFSMGSIRATSPRRNVTI